MRFCSFKEIAELGDLIGYSRAELVELGLDEEVVGVLEGILDNKYSLQLSEEGHQTIDDATEVPTQVTGVEEGKGSPREAEKKGYGIERKDGYLIVNGCEVRFGKRSIGIKKAHQLYTMYKDGKDKQEISAELGIAIPTVYNYLLKAQLVRHTRAARPRVPLLTSRRKTKPRRGYVSASGCAPPSVCEMLNESLGQLKIFMYRDESKE